LIQQILSIDGGGGCIRLDDGAHRLADIAKEHGGGDLRRMVLAYYIGHEFERVKFNGTHVSSFGRSD